MVIKNPPVFMGHPSFLEGFVLFKGSDFRLICQEISQDLPRVYGSDQVGDLSGAGSKLPTLGPGEQEQPLFWEAAHCLHLTIRLTTFKTI